MTISAVIVAAGRGTRVGGDIPKQWRMLGQKVVAAWTLDVFRNSPLIGQIILVLRSDDMGLAPGYEGHADVRVVAGADTRTGSVRAGLEALQDSHTTKVLIHDVARPLVDAALIARVCGALESAQGAAPALALSDALWVAENGSVTGTRDRAGLFAAQTPQGFDYGAILAAHRDQNRDAADDVEIARAAGIDVVVVPGDPDNIKITTESDFARAERIMGNRMDIRTGNGFDVHRFGSGNQVILCGIAVPFDKGLSGHSDADVAMHALTDALYGALADGDIGQHFPPTDPQWKGADSALFLEHAIERARARDYRLGNADITIICENPKIGPHARAMARRLAQILEIDPSQISVKATTTERLGFAGRGEGIAASATVTLIRA